MKGRYFQVAQGVWGLRIAWVNVYFVTNSNGNTKDWILVDTGLPGSADTIVNTALKIFGEGSLPAAIVLTHAHFDHVGALADLQKRWDVPVYAHPLEFPFLTGKSCYPPADPMVGGGLMSWLSLVYPVKPIHLTANLFPLNDRDRVPFLSDWRVIHTPGHSPGHISIYRDLNATLIAGDAFTTIQSESLTAALSYVTKLSGPPKYSTPDCTAAESSIKILAALEPRIAATGHGKPMMGRILRSALQHLVANFRKEAVPEYGRYSKDPAIFNEDGLQVVPPFQTNPKFTAAVFLTAMLVGFAALSLRKV